MMHHHHNGQMGMGMGMGMQQQQPGMMMMPPGQQHHHQHHHHNQMGMQQNAAAQQQGMMMMNNALNQAGNMMAMGMMNNNNQLQQPQPQIGGGTGMMMMPQGQPPMMNMMNTNQFQQQQQQQQQQIKCGPDQSWKDCEFVQFRARPLCATYSPVDDPNQADKTREVQAVFDRGQMQVQGGIHTAIGDPFPGRPKVFRVWFQPSESYRDGETVDFKVAHPSQLVKATYGPDGPNTNDFTQQLRNLIMQGQRSVHGGIHTAVGDPAPGMAKRLHLYYASGAGIDPQKMARLQQQFRNWDCDCSGFLDRSEALAAFFSLFPGMSPTQLQQKISESDTNGDGQLSFDEFARIAAPFC